LSRLANPRTAKGISLPLELELDVAELEVAGTGDGAPTARAITMADSHKTFFRVIMRIPI